MFWELYCQWGAEHSFWSVWKISFWNNITFFTVWMVAMYIFRGQRMSSIWSKLKRMWLKNSSSLKQSWERRERRDSVSRFPQGTVQCSLRGKPERNHEISSPAWRIRMYGLLWPFWMQSEKWKGWNRASLIRFKNLQNESGTVKEFLYSYKGQCCPKNSVSPRYPDSATFLLESYTLRCSRMIWRFTIMQSVASPWIYNDPFFAR